MEIKLTKEQEELLNVGSVIDNKYYFLPFWFEKLEDGTFKSYHLESLPETLKNELSNFRNPMSCVDKMKGEQL